MTHLVKEFQKYPEKFDTKECFIEKRWKMNDNVLDVFDILNEYDFDIMFRS